MKITEAEIIAVLETAEVGVEPEPENTYSVTELVQMWGKCHTTVRKRLKRLVAGGGVTHVFVLRPTTEGGHNVVVHGYTFRGNGDATQGTSD